MNILARVAAVSTASLIFSGAQGLSAPLQQPSDNAVTKQSKQSEPAKKEKVEPKTVVVKSGDTLVKIAKASHTTWQRIYDKNTVITDPDMIYPDQKLTIPESDEKLAHRPLPIEQQPAEEKPAAAVAYAPQPATSVVSTPQPAPSAPAIETTYVAPKPIAAPSGGVWDELANCESSGNWSANTGNGFYGGLQFTLESWRAVGGSGLPSSASRAEQIMRAEKLQAMQGWGAWPVCSVKVGLR